MSEKHTARPWRRNDGPTHPKTEPGDIEIVENDLPSKIILTVHQQYSPVPDRGYGASLEPDDVTTNANANLATSAPTQQAEIDRLKHDWKKDVAYQQAEINRLENELTGSVNEGLADEMKALKLTAHVERLREAGQSLLSELSHPTINEMREVLGQGNTNRLTVRRNAFYAVLAKIAPEEVKP